MTRPLGSFNKQVNLPRHREDHAPSRPQRMAKVRPEQIAERVTDQSKSSDFINSRGRRQPQRRAGDALNVNLRSSGNQPVATAPALAGSAESRTGTISSQLEGVYYQ